MINIHVKIAEKRRWASPKCGGGETHSRSNLLDTLFRGYFAHLLVCFLLPPPHLCIMIFVMEAASFLKVSCDLLFDRPYRTLIVAFPCDTFGGRKTESFLRNRSIRDAFIMYDACCSTNHYRHHYGAVINIKRIKKFECTSFKRLAKLNCCIVRL